MTKKEIYIVLDFSCGRFYTHHSSYLNDYATFIKNKGKEVVCWVNTSADDETLASINHKTKKCIRSIMYGYQRHKNPLNYLIDKSLNVSFKFLKNKINQSTYQVLIKFISKFYLLSAKKNLIHLSLEYDELNLVFPTLDALGFRLIEDLDKMKNLKIGKIAVRITGAEKRGIFEIGNIEKEISYFQAQGLLQNLRIGYEVKNYENIFLDAKIKRDSIFWAPMPTIRRTVGVKNKNLHNDVIKLGFLGGARKNKGFDEIPLILNELIKEDISFQAVVQKPIFSWLESENTIKDLQNLNPSQIQFLEGGISRNELENLMLTCDLLVLPYSEEAYKQAGSGILYLAADLHIPIACNRQVAFSWDVLEFGIGILLENNKLNISSLEKIRDFEEKILKYNAERDRVNSKFLNLPLQ